MAGVGDPLPEVFTLSGEVVFHRGGDDAAVADHEGDCVVSVVTARKLFEAVQALELGKAAANAGIKAVDRIAALRESKGAIGDPHPIVECRLVRGIPGSYTHLDVYKRQIDGSNISASKESIEGGLEKIDQSLKQYLDDMFEDDKMSIETDIAVLQQLMNKDADGVNKMNFDDILKETNGGNENV